MTANPFLTARAWTFADSRSSLVCEADAVSQSGFTAVSTFPRKQGKNGDAAQRLPAITDEAAVVSLLGLDSAESSRCVLVGHDGMAWLDTDHREELVYGCSCNGRTFPKDPLRSGFERPLSDAYYSVRSGEQLDDSRGLDRGTRLVWRLLLTGATGTVEPEPVHLADLAPDADPATAAARQLFALLVGVRLAVADDLGIDAVPTAFSVRLVAAWCGLSINRAHTTIRQLREAGVIERVGREARTDLYAPGLPALPLAVEGAEPKRPGAGTDRLEVNRAEPVGQFPKLALVSEAEL